MQIKKITDNSPLTPEEKAAWKKTVTEMKIEEATLTSLDFSCVRSECTPKSRI
jgi:hypothetical protein